MSNDLAKILGKKDNKVVSTDKYKQNPDAIISFKQRKWLGAWVNHANKHGENFGSVWGHDITVKQMNDFVALIEKKYGALPARDNSAMREKKAERINVQTEANEKELFLRLLAKYSK